MIKRLIIWALLLGYPTFGLMAYPFEEAEKAYLLAEESEEISEREKLFNKALKLYTEAEVENSKLYFNIANCYYQLDQKGIAIWYYYKAKALDPRNQKIDQNLEKALSQAQVSIPSMDKVLSRLFFFHSKFLPAEKKAFFYSILVALVILGSLLIWLNHQVLRACLFFLCAPLTLFGISLTIDYLNRYSKAVLVQPSLIRCDAGAHYKEVSDQVELAGQKVTIVNVSSDQKWVEIKTRNNTQGFVLAEKIRVL